MLRINKLSKDKSPLSPLKKRGRGDLSIFLISCLMLLTTNAQADPANMNQTKAKLQQLETKIGNLKRTLSSAQDKSSLLNKELSDIEKKIGIGVHQLRNTEHDLELKQHKIADLQRQISALNEKLQTQQHLLAKHLRARYTMGEYQPLKWLLNQDTPYTTNRLLTYYQYLVQSRQHIISDIQLTQKNLTASQNKLQQEIKEQQQLQQQINNDQQKLGQDKLYSTAIIQSLNQDIRSKQQTLEAFQHNKENLSTLLKTLTQQSILQTKRPFTSMYKKLPRPVAIGGNHLKNMNQGIIFFANEGAPVTAVFPGKVVFSDWLNGYGLLLIIDHGRGFMTLYAHNQSLFKQKGDIVDEGAQIATVGHSGGLKQNGLYFEIRQGGKAIPARGWLS